MLVSRGARHVAIATCAALVLTIAACGKDTPAPQTTETAATPARLYGTDGNMINSFADEFKDKAGMLAGMKGTTPLTRLSEDFKARLKGLRPSLTDYSYAGETYDAMVISALAAQQAGSTAPDAIANQINSVTTGGTECETAKDCLALARDGADLQYRGVSLTRGGFTDVGEPSTASYATLHFGPSDRLDDSKTEYVGAGDESATTTKKPPAGGSDAKAEDLDPLKIGGLLPETGDLALAYPPMEAAAALAIKEINAAGGVFEKDVEWVPGDDGTNPDVAKETVAKHVKAKVSVIIGAGASSISRAVLPDVIKAGLVLFSPCNTDAGLSTFDDKGLYFRTAPSDILQGRALADVILRDGPHKITIVARNDSYGTGLQGNVKAELERAGFPADQIQTLVYEPPTPAAPDIDFAAGADQIRSSGPDGILVIGFGESAQIIKALDKVGVQIHH
ncbi:ABC transporter substrate-binding protein [Asanoa sp. WMMD1127]|uniref:ABC transporter substrate-binding protein n=1 Tax=Asanoa sp. WMMD1127 TaxID=3016107 RepID=UPI00241706E1|nr:ABC transporter substrate-binding protein [Asanoa sp. WMMD1127]MDG4821923.1 ABC transporter substrate-binding protein [Asanoa sp. WMMD1127]